MWPFQSFFDVSFGESRKQLLLNLLAVWLLGFTMLLASGRATDRADLALAGSIFGYGLVIVNLASPMQAALLVLLDRSWNYGASHRKELNEIDELQRLVRAVRGAID